MSKEKATRISNACLKKSARKGGKSAAYEQWTKAELSKQARKIGIDGRTKRNKN